MSSETDSKRDDNGALVGVWVTVSSIDEGKKLGHALVGERLAACVNIVPGITSIYEWEGTIHDDTEALLVIKTRRALVPALTTRVKELHSYDVPEVVALHLLPEPEGNKPYMDWVRAQTKAN